MVRRCCELKDCNKVLTISAFACKCNKYFCSAHRGSYDHSCSFDYKNDNKNVLMKVMSTSVVADKIVDRL